MSRSRSTQGPYPSLPLSEETVKQLGKTYQPKENEVTDFTYTDSLSRVQSDAIKSAFYNADDKSLLVVMKANGNAYKYSGVPVFVWDDFKNSGSKGRYFATTVKRDYGPSKFAGIGKHLSVEKKGGSNSGLASVSTLPKPSSYVGLGVTLPPQRPARGTTPKGLSVAQPAQGVRKPSTSVTFESVLGDEKTIPLSDIHTVDDALLEFNRLTSMLGVSAKVKAVTVHFE